MDEQQLLSRLRHGDEQALTAVITRFSAYVVTVIHNRSRGLLSPEDEDELASRKLSKRSRHGSCARQSRSCQSRIVRSSGGFTTCARPRRKLLPRWG